MTVSSIDVAVIAIYLIGNFESMRSFTLMTPPHPVSSPYICW
jgi:hypothetical protein